jgi:hypothetical protein
VCLVLSRLPSNVVCVKGGDYAASMVENSREASDTTDSGLLQQQGMPLKGGVACMVT